MIIRNNYNALRGMGGGVKVHKNVDTFQRFNLNPVYCKIAFSDPETEALLDLQTKPSLSPFPSPLLSLSPFLSLPLPLLVQNEAYISHENHRLH